MFSRMKTSPAGQWTGAPGRRGTSARGAAGAGHLGDGADVVEVAVRDQDRLDRRAQFLQRGAQRVRLITWVDQQRSLRAILAGDPGVLLDRPDGQPTRLHDLLLLRALAFEHTPVDPLV